MKSLVAQAFLRAHTGMLDTLLWLFKLLWFRSLLGPCVPPGLPELHCSCEFRACCVQMWNPAAAQAHALCPRCSCGAGPCPQCAVTVLSVSPAQGRAGAAGCGCSSHTCRARLPPELPWARGALTCPAQVGQGWPGVLSTALSPPQDTLELSGSRTNRAESSAWSNAQ